MDPGLLPLLARRRVATRTGPAQLRQAICARLADIRRLRLGPPLRRSPARTSRRRRGAHCGAIPRGISALDGVGALAARLLQELMKAIPIGCQNHMRVWGMSSCSEAVDDSHALRMLSCCFDC